MKCLYLQHSLIIKSPTISDSSVSAESVPHPLESPISWKTIFYQEYLINSNHTPNFSFGLEEKEPPV